MYFVSFQPYDWRTAVREPGCNDMYHDVLGSNTMSCILAERLDIAAVGSLIATPAMPEVAVFFKTDEWWSVDKVKYQMALSGGDAPLARARTWWVEAYNSSGYPGQADDLFLEGVAHDFEFLVNQERVEPLFEIDIEVVMRERLLASGFTESDFRVDSWCSRCMLEIFHEDSDDSGSIYERMVREADAVYWWEKYCAETDSFIQDYKRLIGVDGENKFVTTKYVDLLALGMLRDAFVDNPTETTLDRLVRYLDLRVCCER